MSKSPPAPVRRPPPGPADLQTLVAMRARPRPARRGVGFVECNTVALTYFRRLLEREVGAPIRPILLDRLPAAAQGWDLLVATFFHIEEVQRKVPSREVLGLVALPDFRTLEEVARLSRTARVALVCATDEGVRSKARSLRAVGLRRPRLVTATLGERPRLRAALGRAGALVGSPPVLEGPAGAPPAPPPGGVRRDAGGVRAAPCPASRPAVACSRGGGPGGPGSNAGASPNDG